MFKFLYCCYFEDLGQVGVHGVRVPMLVEQDNTTGQDPVLVFVAVGHHLKVKIALLEVPAMVSMVTIYLV